MLHCLGMTHHLWDCLGGLADRFTLVSYDLPGHGETPVPGAPYGVEELSAQLAAVLRREGIAQAHVMGISLGGLVAQCFAATEPAMVDRLVLCDTTPRYTDEARANWAVRAAAARTRRRGIAAADDREDLVHAGLRRNRSAGRQAGARHVPCVQRRGLRTGLRGTRCRRSACARSAHHGARRWWCAAPTKARHSRTPARWLAQNIAGARLEFVPQAAHASVLEQPAAIERLLRSFLG